MVQSAYSAWKSAFVTTSGAPSGAARVQSPQAINNGGSSCASNCTVSEGIGYGLLLAVYMSDQATFKQLWAYEQAHLDGNGLMNWLISDSGGTSGSGSATDADEDMAWALLMADKQWPGNGYASAGQTIAGKLNGEFDNGVPDIGDMDAKDNTIHPDYFAPAYYPLFGLSVSAGYTLLNSVANSSTGLVPDSSGLSGTNGTTSFGFEGCRAPLRVGLDYCFTGSSSAKPILTKMATWFVGKGVMGLGLPVNVDGSADGTLNPAAAINGPAAVAAMVSSGNQAFIDSSWGRLNVLTQPSGNGQNYFDSSLGVISMLVLSGNFIDYTKL